MEEDACIAKLNEWIAKTKREAYEKNINSQESSTTENPEELFAYKSNLEELAQKLSRAITDENTEALTALHWPDELMECIRNMAIRAEILDCLQQSFTINHFNKSPKHEAELRNETPL